MSYRSLLLAVLFSSFAAFAAAATPTDTNTITPTLTVTLGPPSPTFSPTSTNSPFYTQSLTYTISPTWTASPTPSPVSGTVTSTSTRTPTSSPTPTPTASPSPDILATDTAQVQALLTQTAFAGTLTAQAQFTATATLTPSPAPGSTVPQPSLDDFEDGDLVGKNGGAWSPQAGGGGTIIVDMVAGCTLTASTYAAHCHGTRGADESLDFAFFSLSVLPGQQTFDAVTASPSRSLTFSYKGDIIGTPIFVQLYAGVSYQYIYTINVTDLAWHQITVYFPDSDPSLTTRFGDDASFPWSAYSHQLSTITFGAGFTGSSYSYGFSIDDVYFGEPSSNNSPAQVSASLGMPVSDVQEAYSYQLDEQLTWILIILAHHCGCHPHDIMGMRETRSWGQIAIDLGSTWAAVLAEVDAATAGLAPPITDEVNMERSLVNGVLPTPGIRPQVYVPATGYVLPAATRNCP